MAPVHSGRVLNYASIIEGDTLAQAHRMSKLPFIFKHVALMPDAHLGKGATVGSVIATSEAVIPAAIGVDIGCGMTAVKTPFTSQSLPDDLSGLVGDWSEVVPAGIGQGHDKHARGSRWFNSNPPPTALTQRQANTAVTQLGTLGSGNHFLELCLDETDTVWVILHSGSRGIGNQLARYHIDHARALMKMYMIQLPDPDLSYFVEKTPDFDAYMADVTWAQAYAYENRDLIARAGYQALTRIITDERIPSFEQLEIIRCHHNYVQRENHFGTNVWVTRKGAILAREGVLGLIPGSMGAKSYVVRGLGAPGSFTSAPHGAGRTMSRSQAKRMFTADDLRTQMGDRAWLSDKADALIDEIPSAYKDIDVVMNDSASLVEIVHTLRQIANYKGA